MRKPLKKNLSCGQPPGPQRKRDSCQKKESLWQKCHQKWSKCQQIQIVWDKELNAF